MGRARLIHFGVRPGLPIIGTDFDPLYRLGLINGNTSNGDPLLPSPLPGSGQIDMVVFMPNFLPLDLLSNGMGHDFS